MTDDSDYPTPNHTAPVEEPPIRIDPFARFRASFAEAAAAVNALPQVPRFVLPRIPDLTLSTAPEEPDKRHLIVAVTRVPIRDIRAVDRYHAPEGLTWQTYGQDHDFSTERMLEIINGEEQIIATYPPGAWIHVCYEQYLDTTDQVST